MPGTVRPQGGPPLPVPSAVALALSAAAAVTFHAGPRPDTSAVDTLAYLQGHEDRVRLVGFLVLAAALPLAVYGATAYRRLRRLGVTAPGSVIALVGGTLSSASLIVSGLVTWTAALAAPDLDAGTARALVLLAFIAGGVGFASSLGLLLAGVAVPALVLRLVPRPLAWVGLVLAVDGAVSTFGMLTSALYPLLPVARFGGLAWLVVVGAVLPAQRRRTATAPDTVDVAP